MHRDPDTDDVYDALIRVVDIDPPPSTLADDVSTIVHLDCNVTNFPN